MEQVNKCVELQWFLYTLAHENKKVYGFELIHKKARIINKGYYEGYSKECLMKT